MMFSFSRRAEGMQIKLVVCLRRDDKGTGVTHSKVLNCNKEDKQNTLNVIFDLLHVCLCFIALFHFQSLSGKNAPGGVRQLKLDALLN